MTISKNANRHILAALLRRSPARRRAAGDLMDDTLKSFIRAEVAASLKDLYDTPDEARESSMSAPTDFSGLAGGLFDRRQMEFFIDEMVAASLVHGRQTPGVLRALFGLVPGLIGR